MMLWDQGSSFLFAASHQVAAFQGQNGANIFHLNDIESRLRINFLGHFQHSQIITFDL